MVNINTVIKILGWTIARGRPFAPHLWRGGQQDLDYLTSMGWLTVFSKPGVRGRTYYDITDRGREILLIIRSIVEYPDYSETIKEMQRKRLDVLNCITAYIEQKPPTVVGGFCLA